MQAWSLPACGVRAQFFAAGVLFATWGVHVPTVKAHYGLGEQGLAVAMLAAGVGALGGLTRASRLVARHGARAVAWWSTAAVSVALALLLSSQSVALLWTVLLCFGIANSLLDVSVNVSASDLERRAGRPLMSGFHGMFSLGGMAGAGLGGVLLAAGMAPATHLLLAGLACTVLVSLGGLAVPRSEAGPPGKPFVLPRGTLLLIGVLAALGLIAEGAMYDWSVLFLAQELRASGATAALAYASFSGAMALARFGGDRVRARVAAPRLLQASGVLAAAGMALALLTDSPSVALVGFALVGLGFANIVPVLFSAAATVRGVAPADGIAAVASLGYFGMMVGPPLIGFVAEHRSLTVGLSTVVAAALLLAAVAPMALAKASR